MATEDELLRQWAEQNGADYDLLAGVNNNQQTTTTPATTTPATTTPTTTTPTTTATTGTTTTTTATNDDYLRLWAQQNGADYNLLKQAYDNSGAGSQAGTNPAQDVVNNSYNAFTNQLQQISANTGVSMADLINMAATTPGYGTWNNGVLTVRDPNTGNVYTAPAGGNTTTPPGNGITTPGASTTTPKDTVTPGTTGTIPGIAGIDRIQAIRDMYDAQINAQRAALQESGDQALSDAQANRDKIAGLYNTQRNSASVDWERQRRNFLEGAATSGLNTGAGSQAELSMMSMYQNRQNTLGAAQAQAEADADRNIADIKRSTQASINEAIAKNDYQKAAALLDEYNNLYNRYLDRAKTLASFGDFTGYAAIYGNELATQMFYNWAAQNPDTAYKMGAINQQQYMNLKYGAPINAEGVTYTTTTSGGGGSDWAGNFRAETEAFIQQHANELTEQQIADLLRTANSL